MWNASKGDCLKDQQILFTKFTKQIHGVEEMIEH